MSSTRTQHYQRWEPYMIVGITAGIALLCLLLYSCVPDASMWPRRKSEATKPDEATPTLNTTRVGSTPPKDKGASQCRPNGAAEPQFVFEGEKDVVTLVHISDTHNHLNINRTEDPADGIPGGLPDGDVLLHTGDFTNNGQPEEYEQFNDWLGAVADKYPIRIVVAGNHDVRGIEDGAKMRDNWDGIKKMLPNATHVLCFETVEVEGIKIFGYPWHYWQGSRYEPQKKFGWNGTQRERWDCIPAGVDILMTHGPPRGILDLAEHHIPTERYQKFAALPWSKADKLNGYDLYGSTDLREQVEKKQPKVHIFGHIHETTGIYRSENTLFCNSAVRAKWQAGLDTGATVITATRSDDGWIFEAKRAAGPTK